jgi:hypothetical protein
VNEEPTVTVDALYLDAEHFDLTAQAQQLAPRARIVPTGRPFEGFPYEPQERER